MSMPMNNTNKGGYVPPGFGAGYGSPAPTAPPTGSYGFVPGQQTAGYTPVPQMTYGDTPFNGQPQPQPQHGYAGPPPAHGMPQQFYGGEPPQHYTGGGGYGPGPQPPIITQPGVQPPGGMGQHQPFGPTGEWMNIPPGIPNCPRGLEYLTSIDQLLIKQKVELLEVFTGFETNNKYVVKNALGQKVFYAVEENDCCTRNMCGPSRPFDMKIFDNFRNEVMHLYRPLACSACCFPCCLQSMEVSAPPGSVIGSIEQEWSLCKPQFSLKNHVGDTVLRIEGPICRFGLCGDIDFNVLSLTGENIGRISKQWSGFAREVFTDADFFGINFPLDLDVRMKAVLLGATFLIDAMFFEKSGHAERDTPGMF